MFDKYIKKTTVIVNKTETKTESKTKTYIKKKIDFNSVVFDGNSLKSKCRRYHIESYKIGYDNCVRADVYQIYVFFHNELIKTFSIRTPSDPFIIKYIFDDVYVEAQQICINHFYEINPLLSKEIIA